MKFKVVFIVLLSIIFFQPCFSQQTDSTNMIFDTVYVESAPVVITETVYISELPSKTKRTNNYFLELKLAEGFYANNQIQTIDSKFSLQNSYSSTISFGKTFGHFSVTTGFGFKGLSINNQSDSLYNLYSQKTNLIVDTVDVYYQVVNGVSTPKYVTQLVNKIEPYTYQKDSINKSVSYLKYLEIPLVINYSIAKNKFAFEPSVGLLSSILISSPSELKVLNASNYFSLLGGISVLYKLTKSLSIGCSYQFQNNITNIIKTDNIKIVNNNVGINLRYILN